MRNSCVNLGTPLLLLALLLVGCATQPTPDGAPAAAPLSAEQQRQAQIKREFDAALAAMKDHDDKKAEKLLLAMHTSYPDYSGPLVNLGILYFRNSRADEAQAMLKKALDVNPNNSVAYNHLGILHRQKGEFDAARTAYEKALQISPDYAAAHLNYAILLDLYLGKWSDALGHYQRYQELQAEKDPQVNKWIVDLERRIKSENAAASPATPTATNADAANPTPAAP